MEGTAYQGSQCELALSNFDPDYLLPVNDMDEEDDFLVEAAQQALQMGRSIFNANDYGGAAAYIREALIMINGLSVRQQTLCDTWELRRMLGVCAFHVYEPAEAETALLSVLDNAPKNVILDDARRLQISETAHFLGQTYVRVGDMVKAYRYGEYALRGRRKVLGKSHEHSYESLALMARILDLQGNNLRAEFFVGMIPEDERQTYLRRFEALSPPQILRVDSVLGSNSPVTPLEKSLSSAFEQVSITPTKTPRQSQPRPARALGGSVGAIASDAGHRGTWMSISPEGSPEPSKAAKSAPPLAPQAFREIPRSVPSSQHPPFPGAGHNTQNGASSQPRSVSDRSSRPAMPQRSPPAIPQANPGTHKRQQPEDFEESPRASQVLNRADSASVQISQTRNYQAPDAATPYQLALRPKHPDIVSEAPGNTRCGVALDSSPKTPLPTPPVAAVPTGLPEEVEPVATPHHTPYGTPPQPDIAERRSGSEYTRSSYSQRQSMDLDIGPVQPDIDTDRKVTQQPIGSTTSFMDMFRTKSAASDSNSSIASSYGGLPYCPPSPPYIAERRSGSEYTRSSCSRKHSMDLDIGLIQPDLDTDRRVTEQPIGKKIFLWDMFRNKSAATKASSSITSNPIARASVASPDHAVRLSYSDMSTIKYDAITENVIEFWQEHLEHEVIKDNTKYVLMRPKRCDFLINESEITQALKATLVDFRNSVHVLMPLRSKSGHWSLLLVSSKDELACHYDPHAGRNRALAERVTKRISSFLSKPLKFSDIPDTPDQPHDKDSGIFVCFFMQHLIAKLQSTHVSQKVDATLLCKAIEVKAARKTMHKIAKAANPPITGADWQ